MAKPSTLPTHPDHFAIEANNLCKSFGKKLAVHDVSLKIKKGEIFGFLGPNGSGKTTTIRMLCGLLTPDSGSGHCLGYDIFTQTEIIKLQTGYMTQHFSLYNELTAYENLEFIAHLYGMKNRKKIVAAAIEELGLEKRAHQISGTLSGGWKQRLALTAALLHQPQLLLLDEPTAGVDPKARREFWDNIYYLAAKGITILVSTHYMDEAERCHRLGYIFHGKILIQGTREDIIGHTGLNTWVVNGNDLMPTAQLLKKLPGIEQVVAFGDSLHVSGKDSQMLHSSMTTTPHLKDHKYSQITPSLEDAFISLGEPKNDMFTT